MRWTYSVFKSIQEILTFCNYIFVLRYFVKKCLRSTMLYVPILSQLLKKKIELIGYTFSVTNTPLLYCINELKGAKLFFITSELARLWGSTSIIIQIQVLKFTE